MGREIKRVPLDWDWPLNTVWEGRVLPAALEGRPCDACVGSGQTAFAWWLQKLSYLIGMLADDVTEQQRGRPLHPYLAHLSNGPYGQRPGSDAVDFFVGLGVPAERIHFGGDHHYAAMRALLKQSGVSATCPACKGEGGFEAYPGQDAEREAWYDAPHEPPKGEGWQVWETVSDGSPVTPVFPTAQALAEHLASPASGRAFGVNGPARSVEVALAFVQAGWAPTFALARAAEKAAAETEGEGT